MSWSPDYCTAEELAAYVGRTVGGEADLIASSVTSASRTVDRLAGRQFGLLDAPAARYVTASYDSCRRRWFADIPDLMTEVGLEVAYDTARDDTYATALDSIVLGPRNAVEDGRPWTRLWVTSGGVGGYADGLRVTGRFGWTEVPEPIKQATLIQGSRLVKRKTAVFGIAQQGEDSPGVRLFNRVDPDVEVLVRPYAKVWGAR